jgi:hypothetical protein
MVVLGVELADHLVEERLSDDCQRNDVLDLFHVHVLELYCCLQNGVGFYCWGGTIWMDASSRKSNSS